MNQKIIKEPISQMILNFEIELNSKLNKMYFNNKLRKKKRILLKVDFMQQKSELMMELKQLDYFKDVCLIQMNFKMIMKVKIIQEKNYSLKIFNKKIMMKMEKIKKKQKEFFNLENNCKTTY